MTTTIDKLGSTHDRAGRFTQAGRRTPRALGPDPDETLPPPNLADLELAADPETPADVLTRLARSAVCGPEWVGFIGEVRLSPAYMSVLFPRFRIIAANTSTPPEVLAKLTRCADPLTRLAAVRNRATPSLALMRSAQLDLPDIAVAAEANMLLRDETSAA